MFCFIEVVVPLALDATFTYLVSEAEFEYLEIGMRVAVPFGKSKVYTALVIDKHHRKPELYKAKEIQEILDGGVVVTAKQLEHWKWLSGYYMCSLGEVFRAALPSGLMLESETLIHLNTGHDVVPEDLSDQEYLVYEAMQFQSILKINEIESILNKKTVFPVIQSLLKKGVVHIHEEMVQKYKPKQIRYIELESLYQNPEGLASLMTLVSRAAKQREFVLQYFQLKATSEKPLSVKELIESTGVSSAVIKALVDKGVFKEYYLNQDRVVFDQHADLVISLSEAQEKAMDEVEHEFQSKDVVLLHGVTASGKTEVYIKLIEKALQTQGQSLFLVPEIGLTAQLVARLVAYFGNQVAVYHSRYSQNERVEVWTQVMEGSEKARVVIGTRSALFLPFSNLQFLVIDEEHESSYKQQDPAPRYHARDAAVVLAKFHGAKVLLGSATPSLETYYNANQGKNVLVQVNTRYSNVVLPEVILVDLKEKYKRKQMTGHFSDLLISEINHALSLGEQVILFQNRRGFSPVVECLTCGAVPECPHCDVSLTYHKFRNELRCHYCGYASAMPRQCYRCHSVDLDTKGFGTEQVQEELLGLFPNRRIARMDQDTTRGKYGFEKMLDAFQKKEIDIMVGTQMLAKGLDFDNVNLVGVLNADNTLYHPDFRAHERAYQMLTQLAGRAGRKDQKGRIVIQTYNPYHNILQQVSANDYMGMYKEQMYDRYNFKYPPFYRLIRLHIRHREFQKLKEASFWLYNNLKDQLAVPVLGPEEPAINRIRNQYIRVILIKIPQNKSLGSTKGQVQRILKSFEAIGGYRAVKVGINVDFY